MEVGDGLYLKNSDQQIIIESRLSSLAVGMHTIVIIFFMFAIAMLILIKEYLMLFLFSIAFFACFYTIFKVKEIVFDFKNNRLEIKHKIIGRYFGSKKQLISGKG